MTPADPFDLDRFLQAQTSRYDEALSELRLGRKKGHWIWFVFPQLMGLGHSPQSQLYGVASLDEARAYLAHPVLGPGLRECAEAILAIEGRTAMQLMGSDVDVRKLRSSMTLFRRAVPDEDVFERVLARYFDGVADHLTEELLQGSDHYT